MKRMKNSLQTGGNYLQVIHLIKDLHLEYIFFLIFLNSWLRLTCTYCCIYLFIDMYTLLYLFIYFWLHWVVFICCCTRAFSGCGEQGILSRCGAEASHWSGFSWGAQVLGSGAQQLRLSGSRA